MNVILVTRIVLGVILLWIVLFIIRMIRGITIEKRVANYTLSPLEDSNISLFDQISLKYFHFLSKFSKNSHLIKYANSYNKKQVVESGVASVYFILNKLFIAFLVVVLVTVSFAIQG